MFPAQLAPLVTLVKTELLALLEDPGPLAQLEQLDPEAPLVKMVHLVTLAALVPKERLELEVTTVLQAKTDLTALLDLSALLDLKALLEIQATMELLVKTVPMA